MDYEKISRYGISMLTLGVVIGMLTSVVGIGVPILLGAHPFSIIIGTCLSIPVAVIIIAIGYFYKHEKWIDNAKKFYDDLEV